MAYFDTLEANNRSDKGPSQNPFNYIKSTRGGKATDTKKFLKFNNEGAGIFKTRAGQAVKKGLKCHLEKRE
jgi:hypothetical protein